MVGEGVKNTIKDFNTFIYDHSLHRGTKPFCHCLHAFITEEFLKRQIKDWFKYNGKQRLRMPKKNDYFENSKILREK